MSFFKWEPLTEYEEEKVLSAIAAAELQTSGEIRVRIDKWCKADPLFKAKNVFFHLKMEETKLRNAVLIYVAKRDNKFAIIGDVGIDRTVPADFWESTKNLMQSHFEKGNFADGLEAGIIEVGVLLKEHFPYQDDDINELPNEISYG
ncbi:MAG: hypothetical protein COA58_12260 [Bacteroidetes bacterium]|nr:MAG: hypothetical protein COA58_12260 [Bacteroidota bacterium]